MSLAGDWKKIPTTRRGIDYPSTVFEDYERLIENKRILRIATKQDICPEKFGIVLVESAHFIHMCLDTIAAHLPLKSLNITSENSDLLKIFEENNLSKWRQMAILREAHKLGIERFSETPAAKTTLKEILQQTLKVQAAPISQCKNPGKPDQGALQRLRDLLSDQTFG